MKKFTIGAILLIVVLVAASVAVEGAVIMLLWNWLVVALFGAETISFWLGCGIAFALTIIGSFFKSASSK